MSFAAAVDSLHELAQELAPAQPSAPRRKFDLEHMRILAAGLGDPQTRFPSILIAGTNGKGSTASTLASILTAAGYRTGLYTSPHLSRITERIRTSEPATCAYELKEISEEEFARLYFQMDETARRLVEEGRLPYHPSYFESLTALAFLYFADREVEIAVLEVGMGGRLDATNIVDPTISVVTDIALDHQEFLGNTIAEIAREKAGILRPNGTLVTLPQHPEANQAIGEAAVALNVRGINAADYLPGRELVIKEGRHPERSLAHARQTESKDPENGCPTTAAGTVLALNHYDLHLGPETLHVRSPLAGEHQRRNIALAIAAAVELRNRCGYNIPNSAIEAGISHTAWAGRLEFLPPNLLLDVAHNPAGAWTLRAAIAALPESQPRTLLFSCLRDKDLIEMGRILFPLFDSGCPTSQRDVGGTGTSSKGPEHHLIFAPIDSPRAAAVHDLLATAESLGVPAGAAATTAEALQLARTVTPEGGLILVTGSIYLVGAVRELVLAEEKPA